MHIQNSFRQKITCSLLITGGVLVLEVMALLFLIDAVSKRAASALEKKNLFASLQEETKNFEALARDAKKVQSFIPLLNTALPDQESLITAIEMIDRLGADLNIPASFSLGTVPQQSSISNVFYIEFSVSIDGNYASLRTYMKALHNLPLFVSIDSISISDSVSVFERGRVQLHGKMYMR